MAWIYDEDKADRAVAFFTNILKHSEGKYHGKPFIPAPWQEKVLRDVFGTVDKSDGLRKYREVYIEIPKKNGKSPFGAGLGIMLSAFDGENAAEVYSAAASRGQANVAHRYARRMVRASDDLSALTRVLDSTKTISVPDTDSFYQAISADADINDGINPHGVIFDELHRQKKYDLFNVFRYSQGNRAQPLSVYLTTAGVEFDSPVCWDMHEKCRRIRSKILRDDRFYGVIYALDPGEDWKQEGEPGKDGKPATGWYKANPALGLFLDLGAVRREFDHALTSGATEAGFRRFRCNQWVQKNIAWIPIHEWDLCAQPFDVHDLAGRTCYAGLDLSSTRDVTALVLAFPIEGITYLLCKFWLPEEYHYKGEVLGVEHREPADIASWVRRGLIETTPGAQVDYQYVRQTLNELREEYDIDHVDIDKWGSLKLGSELENDGFEVSSVPPTYANIHPGAKSLEDQVNIGTLRHGGNPVLRWMMDCCSVRMNVDGLIKPVKPKYNETSNRIDGIYAACLALGRIIHEQRDEGTIDASALSVG